MFECSGGFSFGLAGGEFAFVVFSAFGAWSGYLGDGDGVDGSVQLAMANLALVGYRVASPTSARISAATRAPTPWMLVRVVPEVSTVVVMAWLRSLIFRWSARMLLRGCRQVGQAGQSPTAEHPIDSRPRYTQPPGHQMRSFLLSDPIRNDPFLCLRRDPVGIPVGPAGTILQASFAFLPEVFQPPIGGLARNLRCFGGVGHRPTLHHDPIHQQLPTIRCQRCFRVSREGLPDSRTSSPTNQTREALPYPNTKLSTTSLGSTTSIRAPLSFCLSEVGP